MFESCYLYLEFTLLFAFVDFDWSVANDFIVSASSDGTCRLWDPTTGNNLRVIADSPGARTLCCKFHPTNNNLVVVSLPHACTCVHVHCTHVKLRTCAYKLTGRVKTIICGEITYTVHTSLLFTQLWLYVVVCLTKR